MAGATSAFGVLLVQDRVILFEASCSWYRWGASMSVLAMLSAAPHLSLTFAAHLIVLARVRNSWAICSAAWWIMSMASLLNRSGPCVP